MTRPHRAVPPPHRHNAALVTEVLPLLDEGKHTGLFTLAVYDVPFTAVRVCCTHEHTSQHDAITCLDALEGAFRMTGWQPEQFIPSPLELCNA